MLLFTWITLMFFVGIVLSLIIGIIALLATKFIRGPPKSLIGLRVSMAVTAIAVVFGSLGVLYLIDYLTSGTAPLIYSGIAMVAGFMVFQWIISPFLINLAYRTRDPGPGEEWIVRAVVDYAKRAGFRSPPKVKIAEVDAPNAFAYSSLIGGSYIAVTRGLLSLMPKEEVEAVIGHELGHLKHKDVHVILALSLIPVAIFYIGRYLLMWGWLMGGGSSRGRQGNATLYYVGLGLILVIAGVIFQFLVTHFNRLREYFADAHSAGLTGNPRLLQRALARLALVYENSPELSSTTSKSAAMLFIVNYFINATGGMAYDPYDEFLPRRRATRRVIVDIDAAVEELMQRETSALVELFSSHPPIPKRLRFLENMRIRGEKIRVE
ncbi:MAG: M48 family metalloprotease [Desulfurococcales archaeon]|jgi:heat shock protein HtpX|nr:M48 family metalloprotease [Desulfurococcales archaeon]